VLICAADAVTLAARAASSPGGCLTIAAAADGRRCDLYLLPRARMDRPTRVTPRATLATADAVRPPHGAEDARVAGLRVRRCRVARQAAMTFA
jgi:hypothetical protein